MKAYWGSGGISLFLTSTLNGGTSVAKIRNVYELGLNEYNICLLLIFNVWQEWEFISALHKIPGLLKSSGL
jgi:hypothetical protein